MEGMIVKKSIAIEASVNHVWEVLITPSYMRQWSSLPDDYDDRQDLQLRRKIVWKSGTDDWKSFEITEFIPNEKITLQLNRGAWNHIPTPCVSYSYTISDLQGHTVLSLTIGDFSKLPAGEKEYKESIKFADHAAEKIKAIAERMGIIK